MMVDFKHVFAFCAALTLASCAEFRNRGGTVDWLQDRFFFKADTKALRVVRSYMLVAGIARISGKSPLSLEERSEVASKIRTAAGLSRDAFNCAYDAKFGEYGCIFFDDIMSQLDSSLLRLARITFLPEENKDLMAVLQREIVGSELPKELFGAAGKIIEGAAELGVAGGSAVNVVGSLLRIGQNAASAGGRIGPLYRDAQELEMRVVIDGLRANDSRKQDASSALWNCAPVNKKRSPNSKMPTTAADSQTICTDLTQTEALFAGGAGNLGAWRAHAQAMFEKYGGAIRPSKQHFTEVSALLIRACAGLLGGNTVEAAHCARLEGSSKTDGTIVALDKRLGFEPGAGKGHPRGLIYGPSALEMAWSAPESSNLLIDKD